MKRFSLSAFTAIAAFALVAASTLSVKADEYIGGWQKEHPVIKYGVISLETSADIVKSQKKFAAYFGKEFGVEVQLFTASEYAGIMNALASGQIQIGWLGASSYASTWMDCKCVEPIVGAQNEQGGMGYNSVLIVKSDSP